MRSFFLFLETHKKEKYKHSSACYLAEPISSCKSRKPSFQNSKKDSFLFEMFELKLIEDIYFSFQMFFLFSLYLSLWTICCIDRSILFWIDQDDACLCENESIWLMKEPCFAVLLIFSR